MGGRGSAGLTTGVYPKIPLSTRMFNGKHATKEEKAQKRNTVSRFMNEAKAGDVYRTGVGIGSRGDQFEIVSYNRSPNKLGIRSGGRTVALSRGNVESYIGNGARLVFRPSQKRRK